MLPTVINLGLPVKPAGDDAAVAARYRGPLARLGRVICHVTEACNLTCRYCSAGAESSTSGPQIMPLDVVQQAAGWAFAATQRPAISWIFFGGEPLLAPIDWFQSTIPMLQEIARQHNRQLKFGMQTNGTLITDAIADHLARWRIRPSVSLDGPPDIHDAWRGGASQTLAGIRRMSARGMTPTILSVLGPHNIRRIDEVIDFFLQRGLVRVKLNVFYPRGRATPLGCVDYRDLAQARWRILERMLRGDALVDVNTVRTMRLLVHQDRRPDEGKGCGAHRCGGGRCHVSICPDGGLYPCDRAAEASWRLGDIHAPPLPTCYAAGVRRFHASNPPQRRCRDCPASATCYVCCTAYRQGRDVEVLCKAHRLLWPRLTQAQPLIQRWLNEHPREVESTRPGQARQKES